MKIGDKVILNCKAVQNELGQRGTIISSVREVHTVSLMSGNKDVVYSECYLLLDNEKTIMGLKESFILAITPEPKKSFRQAGVTNGDDILTDEGTKIFLTWLLHNKYADEFKTSVIDPLLADQKKE